MSQDPKHQVDDESDSAGHVTGPPDRAESAAVARRTFLKGGVALGVGLAAGVPTSRGTLAVRRADGQGVVWLNVRVEKSMSQLGQTSVAEAWTSSDQAGTNRVAVGELHLVLDAFSHREEDCENCDHLRIDEDHAGSGVTTATAKAWCEGPRVGPVTKSV